MGCFLTMSELMFKKVAGTAVANFLPGIDRFTIVCGHYGCGKTNLSLNLAVALSKQGKRVYVVDCDIVNPYFRSSDYKKLLDRYDIHLIAPTYAHSNLDVPSLPAEMYSIFSVPEEEYVIVDVGGDDVGATVLGRFSEEINSLSSYSMLYVINQNRIETATAERAVFHLREIERASRIQATGIINNSHLQKLTTTSDILRSIDFAEEVSKKSELPCCFHTAPHFLEKELKGQRKDFFFLDIYVTPPWEITK